MSARRGFTGVGPRGWKGMDFTDQLRNFSLVSRGRAPIIAIRNKVLLTEILARVEIVGLERFSQKAATCSRLHGLLC